MKRSRRGAGCGGPSHPAGAWRKATFVLGIKADTSNGGAGGANSTKDISTSTSSKWESPFLPAYMRTYFIPHLAFSYERKHCLSPHSISKKVYSMRERKT